MTKYFVDTNVFLRFLLKDNKNYFNKAKKYLTLAKEKKIVLILIPQVLFEIDYVLKGVYSISKKERVAILSNLVKSPALAVENRKLLIEVVEKYEKLNIDLFDIYLWTIAHQQKAKILSFDKDFKKIKP
jgi:predicted nucleic acid-binding protein